MNAASSRPLGRFIFAVLMLVLMVLFAGLGAWQVQRLAEKEALIAAVADGIDGPPQALPPVAQWDALDPQDFDYRPLTVEGRFVTGRDVRVFTSLADPKGESGGPGYWVLTPFELAAGGTIFVNRGFVPQAVADDLEALAPIVESTELLGIARRAERSGPFTPEPDAGDRIDWVRAPERLALLAGIEGPVAPLYLDLPAGAPGELPQGGETVVEFSNNHLGYAITWFGFAILAPILLVVWLRRQRTPDRP